MEKPKSILAIDIGGSKLAWGLVEQNGEASHVSKYIWERYEPEHVISVIIETVQMLLDEAEAEGREVAAIGITIPGFADPRRGIWISASFMGIYNLPIVKILEDRFHYPVFIEKDTNACCLAEKLFGACRDADDFLYMTVSNGIGGAFFLNGALYYGAHGFAGEFGMCVVEEDGRLLESEDHAGSLEIYASGRGIRLNYRELGGQLLPNGREPDGQYIAALCRFGDPIARETFRLEGYYLAKVIASACNLLDPEKVIIGGGLSLAFDCYRDALEENLRKHHYKGAEYSTLFTVEPTVLGYNGGLLGAASVAILGLRKDSREKLGYLGGQ